MCLIYIHKLTSALPKKKKKNAIVASIFTGYWLGKFALIWNSDSSNLLPYITISQTIPENMFHEMFIEIGSMGALWREKKEKIL